MTRTDEYDSYLAKHIGNVQRSWFEILRPYVLENLDRFDTDLSIFDIDATIELHDESKYGPDEYWAYLGYFYPNDTNDVYSDEEAQDVLQRFNYAWLHHIHHNPHHWQHWILREDEGDDILLDIPFEYICEMLCDWHSFSYDDPKNTAYNWYLANKDKIMLSYNTQAVLLGLIKVFNHNPLEEV